MRAGAVLRIVADTNTVVSALLWQGTPHRLFEAIETAGLSFFTSRALLDELAGVLPRRKLARAVQATGKSIGSLLREYEELTQAVQPRPLRSPIGRDSDDQAVLACALAADADFIVSGDKDLRILKTYRRIRILNAAEALALIELGR